MIESLDKLIQDGVDRGLLQKFTSNEKLDSSEIAIDDERYINFGSCSYLGLEYHPRLKQAVHNAVDQFGTQFSTSRTYLSIGQYDELENQLSQMFGQPALVTASTTLGHLAALPIIIQPDDVVILDLQVHSSVQMTAQILKANKVAVHLIPHNNMESLEAKIKTLQEKANRIWYLADGVYSMYGDYAPLKEIEALMDKYKKFHFYVDDAHGMGWTGENGMGYVRSQMKHHDKMVMATSLNKSFASSGGVLLFPNKEMHRKVKNCGTTMIFSGPIQPPMLGAAIESAKMHQEDSFKEIQNELKEKVAFTNRRLKELDIPQFECTDSPLFFIPVGLPRVILAIIKRMKKRGFYLNSAGFPATPMKKGGLRFMINNNISFEEIDNMLTTLQEEYVKGLLAEGSSPEYVASQFKLPPFLTDVKHEVPEVIESMGLTEYHYRSAEELNHKEWDAIFAGSGSNELQNLKRLEKVFHNESPVEQQWDVRYHVIRDQSGEIVLASVYTTALMMDDLLAEKEISVKLKELRKDDPYYLTSHTLMTGTPFTKGRSLYVNFDHDDWKEAVKSHVEMLQDFAEQKSASKVILRDFEGPQKNRLESLLMDLGMLPLDLPNNCVVNDMSWKDTDELMSRLTQKYRYSLRKEILKKSTNFMVRYDRPTSDELINRMIELYLEVHYRSTEISVFELPRTFFESMFADPSYDFIQLYLAGGPEEPVAVMMSQIIDGVYHAQLVGLDYDYVREHGTYKQILYQTVKRAKELGCRKVDMAYTAEMEKKKVGAVPESNYGFVMALEHDSYAEMQLLK